ncbi:MAG TPA: M28 family peptidase, partial [Thermoguttaceae bacterium]|nr:M28 family peptidase [Thermoguttaceae bacterium]
QFFSAGAEKLPPPDAELDALAQTLRRDVEVLAGEIGPRSLLDRPEKLSQAAHYIQSRMEGLGYPVDRQEYSAGGQSVVNLTVQRFGGNQAGQILLVGAHYDTVFGSPGADDNATGIAALLALAERFAQAQPSCTLRFAAFANEEPPFFHTQAMGSFVYAQRCQRRGESISAMICLESLGYYDPRPGSQQYPLPLGEEAPSEGNFIAFVSNEESEQLLRRAADLFGQTETFPRAAAALSEDVPGAAFSDQWAFWRQGYPAVMVTDTAMYRNPYYHTSNDTPDKIHWDHFARVVRGLEGVVRSLAN